MTTFEDLAGAAGTPFRMVVEEGKVREFARASRSTALEHFREGDPVAPAAFLATALHWQSGAAELIERAGFDMRRVLHGGEAHTFHGGLPRAGDVLHGTPRVDRTYVKEGGRGGRMRFLEIVTEFRDGDGRLVADVRGTIIETGAPEEGGE